MCQLRKGWYKNVDPGALALCVPVKNVMLTGRVFEETVTDFLCVCVRPGGGSRPADCDPECGLTRMLLSGRRRSDLLRPRLA